MNTTRTTTWTSAQILTASALNGEFNGLLGSPNIVNADIASGAAIAYSKLNLTGSIVNADISAAAAIDVTKLSVTVVSTTGAQTLTNKTFTNPVISGIYDNGNSGSSSTINWANGDMQKILITAGCTLSYSNAVAGQRLTLLIDENGTGNFSITLPTSKWPNGVAGVFTTTANALNAIVVIYDGTNYRTQLAGGFA